MREPPNPALGTVLKRLREERELTQEDVAFAAGLNVSGLSKIERGHNDPLWTTVERIAAALDVSLGGVVETLEAEDR